MLLTVNFFYVAIMAVVTRGTQGRGIPKDNLAGKGRGRGRGHVRGPRH